MIVARVAVFGLAWGLASLAGWILAAEALRPAIAFTTDAQSAVANYAQRDAAITAARVGVVRGDLWSEAAFAYGGTLWNQGKATPNAGMPPFNRTQELTERAIAHAPHDSRLWLLLAVNYFRFDWLNERAAAALRMSYYTGSSLMTVVPQRMVLAMQSRALQDGDFQDLVRHDIRIALAHKPELMSALSAAYDNAPPSGREFMERTLAEFDPSALATVRSGSERR